MKLVVGNAGVRHEAEAAPQDGTDRAVRKFAARTAPCGLELGKLRGIAGTA